jgi:Mn2+/Fe2+ NRAMP family transporter
MFLVMSAASRRDIMGDFIVTGALRLFGWLSAAFMAAVVAAMLVVTAI